MLFVRRRPHSSAWKRVEALLAKLKDGTIRATERRELYLFVQLDHVMSLAKAKARAKAAA
jgi:hypothetical protein